jgi:glycosyltransferase involved in cell wall biosynthesis
MASPRVTVVVATRNRRAAFGRCLDSLLAQEPEGLAELVMVDDGSTDGTAELLDGFAHRLLRLRTEGQGPAAARNAGIRRASAALVAITDDDCIAPPHWAQSLVDRLQGSGAAAVGGRVVAGPDVSLPARLSQAITNGLVTSLRPGFLTANNVAYRVSALRAVGAFDEAFRDAGGEERDLHARLMSAGQPLLYAPDIVVWHQPALSWSGFLRQQASYGRGSRLLRRRARERGAPIPYLSPAQYARAFRSAFRDLPAAERPYLLLGLPLSQLAVVWGYMKGPGRGATRTAPRSTREASD